MGRTKPLVALIVLAFSLSVVPTYAPPPDAAGT